MFFHHCLALGFGKSVKVGNPLFYYVKSEERLIYFKIYIIFIIFLALHTLYIKGQLAVSKVYSQHTFTHATAQELGTISTYSSSNMPHESSNLKEEEPALVVTLVHHSYIGMMTYLPQNRPYPKPDFVFGSTAEPVFQHPFIYKREL